MSKNLKRKITIDYYTLNVKVLPVKEDKSENSKRYSSVIDSWFKKDHVIVTKGDARHYYALRELRKLDEGKIFYGVITKYVSFDKIDFIDNETKKIIPRPIPDNVEGRVSEYEFVFVPEVHRFAFVKLGKIDSDVKRIGAPLGKMQEIIKVAFDSLLEVGESSFVEVVQEEFVFEQILNNDLLSLVFRVSYTNDDVLPEGKKLMDNLMRNDHIGEFFGRIKPDNSGKINTDGSMTRGILELARENGMVKARIDTGDELKTINSIDYPAINSVEAEDNSSRFMTFVRGIYEKMTKGRNGEE